MRTTTRTQPPRHPQTNVSLLVRRLDTRGLTLRDLPDFVRWNLGLPTNPPRA